MKRNTVLKLSGVERHYGQGDTQLSILKKADLTLNSGEIVALVAPSGTGKSTLLHLAGLLEHPDSGEVSINGHDLQWPVRRQAHGDPPQRDRLRLPVPSSAAGVLGAREHHDAADDRRPAAQGGQAARQGSCSTTCASAIAAPIVPANCPAASSSAWRSPAPLPMRRCLLLADEPTGNLDPETASYVFEALEALVRQSGLAALIATHNHELARRMDRRVTIADGKVVDF
jgi:lipoprotein-releasing system ATP-binding protein